MGDELSKLRDMRQSNKQSKTTAENKSAAISAYVGAKKKEKDDKGKTMVADIEKVDASKIAAQKAEAERQYEENKKKQRKRSAIEIAMGTSE